MEIHGNQWVSWESWNSTKFIDFLDSATLHETFVFLAQNQGLSGLDPQKPKNTTKTIISLEFTKISPFPAGFLENPQNDAKITFWRILVVPWPPHAENLDKLIPIGILRFLSSPGGLETLQNTKTMEFPQKWENSAKIMKYLKISWNSMKVQENDKFWPIFRKLGAQKPWYSLGKTMICAQGRPVTPF